MNLALILVGWILGAGCLGLWWGERARRIAAERYLTTGNPALTREKPVMRGPAAEAEDRIEKYSQETLERAVASLRQQAKEQGIEGISDAQFEADAEALLQGMDVGQ